MRLVVTAITLALITVLAPFGHNSAESACSPRNSSSQGHEPLEHKPKQDEPQRKLGEKITVRAVSCRRSSQRPPAQALTLAPRPPSTGEPAGLGDARRVEHLRLLVRPVVLQVFRN